MRRRRLREVTMLESRSSNRHVHWWKWESSNKEWWGHPMLNNNCTLNLANSMVKPTRLHSRRPHTKVHLEWIMALNVVHKEWLVDPWLERRTCKIWETNESTNSAKTSMACNSKTYKTWLTVARTTLIWSTSCNLSFNSQSIQACSKQLFQDKNRWISRWWIRQAAPSRWTLAAMLNSCIIRTNWSIWATFHFKR